MEKKRDLRIQKTYDALITAFEQLLQEKSFEKITVRELCDRAKTRTATFYSHFSDKYDFFSFMVKELRRGFAEKVEHEANHTDPADYYVGLLREGLVFLEQHEKMAHSVKNDHLLVTMMQTVSDDMTVALEKHLTGGAVKDGSAIHSRLMVQAIIGAMNQVTAAWFFSPKRENQEIVICEMRRIIQKMIG